MIFFFTMRENDFWKKNIFGFEFFVHVRYTCLNLFQSLLHWNISLINILIFLDIKNILSKISLGIKQRSRKKNIFLTSHTACFVSSLNREIQHRYILEKFKFFILFFSIQRKGILFWKFMVCWLHFKNIIIWNIILTYLILLRKNISR